MRNYGRKRIGGMENVNIVEESMEILFSKLDEALNGLENGRVLLEEELWAELDAI